MKSKQPEKSHLDNLKYFEGMNIISEILSKTMDADRMLKELTKAILKIFSCDRAWLLYPCDPKAKTFKIPVETNKPEYPGGLVLNLEVPMNPVFSEMMETILSSKEPVIYSPEKRPLPQVELHKKFNIKSQLTIALYPKTDKPWMLGIHQCSYIREWTDGELKLFKDIANRVSDALNNLLLYKRLIKSESALKKANRELVLRFEELKKVDKIKDNLLSDVSHELKTPVAKHRMYMDLLKQFLKEKGLSNECFKITNIIDSSLERQERTISNILDLFHIEKGEHEYKFAHFRIDKLLNEIITDYQPALKSKAIKQKTTLPAVTVISDSQMLYHVFSNIINNAVKFRNKKASSRISIILKKRNNKAIVKIIDNGVGLDIKEKQKVFDRFYQASVSVPGSGVGLAIVKMIIADLKGGVLLESPGKGKGTTVTLEIPLDLNKK